MVDKELSRSDKLECLLSTENIVWMESLIGGLKCCALHRFRHILVSGVIMATPIMGSTSHENKGASNGIQIWIVTFAAKVV